MTILYVINFRVHKIEMIRMLIKYEMLPCIYIVRSKMKTHLIILYYLPRFLIVFHFASNFKGTSLKQGRSVH